MSDLVFNKAPLTRSPVVLVFNEEEGNDSFVRADFGLPGIFVEVISVGDIESSIDASLPILDAEVWVSIFSPPTIVEQPASQAVVEGALATFSVQAVGDGFLAYQWRKNGQPITGATSSAYSRVGLLEDSGSAFTVTVYNVDGSVESAVALLTVTQAEVLRVADPTIVVGPGDWRPVAYALSKRPREVREIVIEMEQWLANRGIGAPMSITGVTFTSPMVVASSHSETRLRLTIAGGDGGSRPNVHVLVWVNTSPANAREIDLFIDVLEVK